MKKCAQKGTDATRLIQKVLALSAGAIIGMSGPAYSGPEGGQVMGGTGLISLPDAATTLIQQQSQNLAIDWQRFNVASNERVLFQQPSASAAVLNRILDQNPSQIFGSIEANGRVFLSNPNGIIFGASATVNVGSLFATGLDMSSADFMSGRYEMGLADGESAGVVINRGIISAATGGSVTLVGGAVSNEGLIIADVGYVNLAAGRKAVVDFRGDGSIRFQVDEAVLGNPVGLDSAVSNSGEIRAEGGQVLLSGHAAQDVFTRVVNNDGVIRAGRIDDSGGTIRLLGSGGDVYNSGTLDAVSGSGQGGDIDVLGDRVAITSDAQIDASGTTGGGNVRIGGDYQGANPDVQNASRTYVGSDASIMADATEAGDGGRVIVWADEVTRFYGSASVQGGNQEGNGGFVEISGKETLVYSGDVNLLSPTGSGGTLLLDPTDITIQSGAGNLDGEIDAASSDDSILFADGAANTTLDVAELTAGFTSGDTIILQASSGNITFTVDTTLQSGVNLVVQAGGNISVDDSTAAAITVQAQGAGTIHLEADSPHSGSGDGTGSIIIGAADTLQTASGAMTLIGADFSVASDATVTSSGGGGITLAKSVNGATLALGTAAGTILSDTELDNITTSGTLTIGEATTKGTDGAGASASTLTAGAITLDELTLVSQDVTLISGSTINDDDDTGAAIATSGTLTLTSGGAIGGLGGAQGLDTDVGTLTVTATGGNNVTVTESDALILGGVAAGAGTVDLTVGGDLTQTGAITAAGLVVTNTTGTTALTGPGNDVTDLAATATGQTFSFTDTDDLDIDTVNTINGITATTVNLTAGGDLTQQQGIMATNLSLTVTSGDIVTFTNAGNTFTNLTIDTDDSFEVSTTGALTDLTLALDPDGDNYTYTLSDDGTLTSFTVTDRSTGNAANKDDLIVTNISSSGLNISLTNKHGDGDVEIGGINVGAGTVTLVSNEAIIQTGAITAAVLDTTSDTGTTLNSANVVEAFTAVNSTSGNVELTNNTAGGTLDVQAVSTGGGNLELVESDVIDLSGVVNAGAGTVDLTAGGAISQSGGSITADTLNVNTGATYSAILDSGSNNITNLGTVTASGGFTLDNGNNSLTVDDDINTSGSNGAVVLSAGTGTYTQNNGDDINAGTGTITITADTVAINESNSSNALQASTVTLKPAGAGRTMSLAAASDFDLTQAEITVILDGTDNLVIGDSGSTAAMTIGGAVSFGTDTVTLRAGSFTDGNNASRTVTAGTLNLDARTGDIGSSATNGEIDVAVTNLSINTQSNNNAYVKATGAVNISENSSVGTGTLDLTTAGDLTDSDSKGITAGTLIIDAGSNAVDLDSGSHAVTNLGAVSNITALTLDNGNNSLTVTSAIDTSGSNGAVVLTTGTGIYSQNDVDITAGSGAITITADSVALTDNTLDNALQSTGTVTLKPDSAGTTMSLAGSSTFDLTQAEITDIIGGTNTIVLGDTGSTAAMTIGGAVSFGTDTVTLRAGSFTDGNNSARTVTAGTLNLDARTGDIGASAANGAIDTAVTTLTINTVSGSSYIADTGAVALGSVSTDALTLSAGGNITDSGVLDIGGAASFTTTALNGSVTLDQASDIDGALSVTTNGTGTTSVTGLTDAIELGTVTTASLIVSADGNITDSGVLDIGGAASLTTTGSNGSVTLNSASDIDGALSVTTDGTGTTSVTNLTDAIALGTVTTAELTISANGNITDSGVLDIGGAASFTTTGSNGSVALNSLSDIDGALGINTNGTGTTSVTNLTDDIELGAVDTTSLTISADGSITDSGEVNASGNALFTAASGADILLGTTTNTFGGTITLAPAGTLNDVTLYDDTALALSALSISGDLTVTTEGTLAIDGAQASTDGDIRLVATGNVTQSANITAESGSAKVFSDSGTITMGDNVVTSAGANANDRAIVYTSSGDVTIAVLETRNSGLTVEVTSQTGDVMGTADGTGHPLETANITGTSGTTGTIANIHAIAADKDIGAEPLPFRFDNSAVSEINYGLNGGTLYHSGESGNQLATPPITLEEYPGLFSYESSSGLNNVVLAGGSIVDVPGLILSGTSGAAAAAESAFLNIDASLLKKRIKIYNIVGQGLLLPKHQLDDDDEEDELELEEEEEGGLTYLFPFLPLLPEQQAAVW
ncbi:MAG: filamentous hemagglutinin N-terminal domain-containing protein [Candidatus Sedimenticola sp. (ex Thyasira tokunagai)]